MKKHKTLIQYLLIILGSFIMGFAIKSIYDPAGLVTGGVSGVAIIVKHLVDIPLWLTNTVLNIPLFLVALKLKGWKFIRRTLAATISLSVSLLIIPEFAFLKGDLLLSSLFGGAVCGIGTGMVFAFRATTGGSDMLASLIQMKLRQFSVPQIMFVIDGIIVLTGATVFGIRYALYAIIAIFVVTRISGSILNGLNFSKQAIIISDNSDEIAAAIMRQLERGVTSLEAMGMYSGKHRKMLICVVSPREIVMLRDIVRCYDRRAFVIIDDVSEVLGEGFIEDLY